MRKNNRNKYIYCLFEDIENRYNIEIDEIMKRRMAIDICNLIYREVYNLDELETYIIRCLYYLYYDSVGDNINDISGMIGYDTNKVHGIICRCYDKIYNYILKSRKINVYGEDSIYNLECFNYEILSKIEECKYIYISQIRELGDMELFQMLLGIRQHICCVFSDREVWNMALRDLNKFREEIDMVNNRVLNVRYLGKNR